MRLIGLASGLPHEMANAFVVAYDPEVHLPDGKYDGGLLVVTRDESEAGQFTAEEALALWRSGPTCKCHRLRADGNPNKPLTAFTIECAAARSAL